MHDVASGFDVVFQVGHEVCAVAFDLLVGGDGTKNDLGELATFEGSVGYSAVVFY